MATVDFEALKRELKIWQRAFKAEHGRDISKDDLKANPAIGAKYAIYKKLGKEESNKRTSPTPASFPSKGNPNQPPSTPRPRRPQQKSKPIPSLFPKSLPVEDATTPYSTGNPFSPTKKRAVFDGSPNKSSPMKNPFLVTQSSTSATSSNKRSATAASSVLFGPVSSNNMFGSSPTKPSTSSQTPTSTATSTTAYEQNSPQKFRQLIATAASTIRDTPKTKARKRLRGEEVMETPGDKRRKVRDASEVGTVDDINEEDDDDGMELSPAKPLVKPGKNVVFRPTFDDFGAKATTISTGPSASTSIFGRTKQTGGMAPTNKSNLARARSLQQIFSKDTPSLQSKNLNHSTQIPLSAKGKEKESSKRLRLEAGGADSDASSATGSTAQTTCHPTIINVFGLRPPSPGPGGSKGKTRSQKWGDRKRARVQSPTMDEDVEDEKDIEEKGVKELAWRSWGSLKPSEVSRSENQTSEYSLDETTTVIDLHDDLLLLYRATNASLSGETKDLDTSADIEDNVVVDLPDEMKDLLVLDSPKKRQKKRQEEAIVEAALRGRGIESKTCDEVWGIGETQLDDETEENDWESEPEGWVNTVEM